ncbi:hypothetical protein Taro_036107 [Colocasia esculenta]|uniref:Uncharacterized protein n=1 Tax=Colocasia esculenta TaxID=4460 RepID=A0A843W8P9_COLES|nr:hypothetical protein [Colocasia esculenta]
MRVRQGASSGTIRRMLRTLASTPTPIKAQAFVLTSNRLLFLSLVEARLAQAQTGLHHHTSYFRKRGFYFASRWFGVYKVLMHSSFRKLRASLSSRQKKESAQCGGRILVSVERTGVVSVNGRSIR